MFVNGFVGFGVPKNLYVDTKITCLCQLVPKLYPINWLSNQFLKPFWKNGLRGSKNLFFYQKILQVDFLCLYAWENKKVL